VRLVDGDARLVVEGDLTISGSTRPITAQIDVDAEGRVSGTIPLAQSNWGSKPIVDCWARSRCATSWRS